MSNLIPVTIAIADRTYRLKIEMSDEEMVRGIAKIINEKIVEFKAEFAGKDMQDYVAMVLLWLATEQKKDSLNIYLQKENDKLLNNIDVLIQRAFLD